MSFLAWPENVQPNTASIEEFSKQIKVMMQSRIIEMISSKCTDCKKVINISDSGLILSGNINVSFTDQRTMRRLYTLARSIHEGKEHYHGYITLPYF